MQNMSENTDDVEDMETEMSPERDGDTPSPQVKSPKVKVSPEITIQPPDMSQEEEEQEDLEMGELDHDPTRSEGMIDFKIENFSKIAGKLLSQPVYIRDLPWRLLVMPREVSVTDGRAKSLGIFVQCNPKSPESASWNIAGRATIKLISHENPVHDYSREVFHCFCARENDWGFSNFMVWKDVTEESKGFVKNDTITLQAEIVADAPHGINWDSRKYTGFVGLKNQGATCYMNSLLQTLYCTNKLRQAVYMIPTDNDDPVKSVPLALQRLFYDLQHSDKPVGTRKLTKSFGWDTMDIFMQHDVQELSRVLLDNLESKMKGTIVEGTISKLFEGKMESYIKCCHVDYVSSRVETFFDVQLNVKDKKDVFESFKDYTSVETMNGENKYDAGEHGLQEAQKGVIFISFPPVLHLHLMRFQYDPLTDTNVKLNDKYAFPEQMNLDKFLKVPESTPAEYTLLAVLVHSGDNYGGHYVVYVNPQGKGKWLKFDDDVVSTCSMREAVENNFGGNDDTLGIRNCTNAYMLVYVRNSAVGDSLLNVTDEDISRILVARFAEEKQVELLRRKERNEAHLYMAVEVYTEDDFQSHQNADLLDFEDVKSRSFKVLKTQALSVFMKQLAEHLGYPETHIRLWPFERRSNYTTRPSFIDKDVTRSVFQHADCKQPWRLFVETLPPGSKLDGFGPYDEQSQVLLFYKYYDPLRNLILYMGHSVEPISKKFLDLFPALRERAGLSSTTPLLVYEEVKPSLVERIDPNVQLCDVDEIRDGDIVCYQRADLQFQRLVIPTVDEYFRELYNRCDISFYDKNVPSDPGFTLTLNQRMTYPEMARAVSQHLDTAPQMLQFFRPQLTTQRNFSQFPLRSTVEGCIRDFVRIGSKSRLESPPMLCYQHLPIPVEEFENKKWFHCVFVNLKLREEKDFNVYVDKNGTVEDLLNEAKKEISFDTGSTGCLRLLEVMTNRIVDIFPPEKPVSELYPQRVYRVEEVKTEEMDLKLNESLIPVAHFQKAPHNVFGIPFLLKIEDGENLSKIAERVQSLLEIGEKEFDKWRFAIVETVAPIHYLSEENDDPVYFSYFLIDPKKGIQFPHNGLPLLGIDHINKNPKRTRYTAEKAIKIHN